MPSAAWLAARRQVTFWLTRQEYADLGAACKRRGVSMSDDLRQAVAHVLKTP